MGFLATAFRSKHVENERANAIIDGNLSEIRGKRVIMQDAVKRLDGLVSRTIQDTIDSAFDVNARVTGRRRPDDRHE